MSNLIKSNFISFDQLKKRVIDSDSQVEKFIPINFRNTQKIEENVPHEFVEGIKIINLDEKKETEEEIEKQKQGILDDANERAKQIMEEAKSIAEVEKQRIYEESKKLGYAEGYNTAIEEVEEMKKDLNHKLVTYQENYAKEIEDIEPSFAKLLVEYIRKLTGIMEEDHNEIIYYLVHQAVMGVPNSNHYIIKVSKEDYAYVEKRVQKLISSLKKEVELNILEDSSLSKNQCFIETDARTVDCSLKVQMENLITDIKLLAKI